MVRHERKGRRWLVAWALAVSAAGIGSAQLLGTPLAAAESAPSATAAQPDLRLSHPFSVGIAEPFAVEVTNAIPGAVLELMIGTSPQGAAVVDEAGFGSIRTALWVTGSLSVFVTETTYRGGVPSRRTTSGTITVGSGTTTITPTVPPSTVPSSTVPSSTVPPTTGVTTSVVPTTPPTSTTVPVPFTRTIALTLSNGTVTVTCPTAVGAQSRSFTGAGLNQVVATMSLPVPPSGPCSVAVTPLPNQLNQFYYQVSTDCAPQLGSSVIWSAVAAVQVTLNPTGCFNGTAAGNVTVLEQRRGPAGPAQYPISWQTLAGTVGGVALIEDSCVFVPVLSGGVAVWSPRCTYRLGTIVGTGPGDGDPATLTGLEVVVYRNGVETEVHPLPDDRVLVTLPNTEFLPPIQLVIRPRTSPTTAVPTTAVPTTAVPTTAVPTTAVPTTAVPTTAAPTTRPTTVTSTTLPQQPFRISFPGSVAVGKPFAISIVGATPGAYLDVMVGNSSQGGAIANSRGVASVTTALWPIGTFPLTVTETSYRLGVPHVRKVTASITVR